MGLAGYVRLELNDAAVRGQDGQRNAAGRRAVETESGCGKRSSFGTVTIRRQAVFVYAQAAKVYGQASFVLQSQ